ncbi:hypothetical protein AtNW77_Chr3g0192991 [Arabidopsis thaliana]
MVCKTVHYLLCRQLRVLKKELWCLVAGQPIRFGLNEFSHITRLNTDPLPTEKFELEADYKAFFSELGVRTGRVWPPGKRKLFGLLSLLAIGLYGLHPNSRIPFESAKRVFDDEALNTYPWGRTTFEALIVSIKLVRPIGKTYTIIGMAFVLQAWAYDSIITIGEQFGNVVKADEIPLLRWGGNRIRATIESAIAEDIKTHGGELCSVMAEFCSLRVHKMVMKDDVSELFHTWPDEVEDLALDHLIEGIHGDKLVKGYWDVKTNEKKKKLVKDKAADVSESPAKKQKVSHSEGVQAGGGDAQK